MGPPVSDGFCRDYLAGPLHGTLVGSDSSPVSGHDREGVGMPLANNNIRIIGIDPGLRRTGWGVIDYDGVRLGFVACGSVVSDETEGLGLRLRQLFDGLQEVL